MRSRLRRLERLAEGEMLVIPQRDGTVAKFPRSAVRDALMNFSHRLGAGEDAPPEHPLLAAARTSSDPEWRNSFFSFGGANGEGITEPIEDLSEGSAEP